MAYSLQIEGQGTGGNSESTTTNWLKSNNLSHLIPIFKQNAITISELSEMPKDELTEMLQALGLDKINLPRVRSKIMKLKMKNNNNNNQYQYQQQQIPQKVIITEAETVDDSDDDCEQEAFIDPSDKTRRKAICDTSNANDAIIKCIGSLRIEYADKNKLTKTDICLGTATIFDVDENNNVFILTAAHNGYQFLRKCASCNISTIRRRCGKCGNACRRVKPLDLIKATTISFSSRCIVKKVTDPTTGEEKLFGDPLATYDIEQCMIRNELYTKYSSGKEGYDICVMKFKCKDSKKAMMFREICENIKLVSDDTFGKEWNAKLYLFGYPGDKNHKMYGMSTGMDGHNFEVGKNENSDQPFIINRDIDTQGGQSGSTIWSYYRNDATGFRVYGIHTGGKQEAKSGVNFGTFLDNDTISWINHTKFKLSLKRGFNVLPSEKREYIASGYESKEGMSVSTKTTKTHIISSLNDDEKKENDDVNISVDINEEKRPPEKLFADENHKIILMCGKTGTGKSTLINSMVNYIHGIEQEDKFRLKLIVEPDKSGGDSESQTDHISSYRIKKPIAGNINYDLTIIDTPGFGDVRGLSKDDQTVKEFMYVFESILTDINGICFVVQASNSRLDASQTYVFNSVLNLWGKDVTENIFILMTFADGGDPRCIDALDKINVFKECKHRFKMNNSAFTMDPLSKSDAMEKRFWDMGMECFRGFFEGLDAVHPKAIEISKEVIIKRETIKAHIDNVQTQLNLSFMKLQQIETRKQAIKDQKEAVDEGKEVKWKEWEMKYDKVKTDNDAVICIEHQRNCHMCYWGCAQMSTFQRGLNMFAQFGKRLLGYKVAQVSDLKKSSGIECYVFRGNDGTEIKQCAICSCDISKHEQGKYKYVETKVMVIKSNFDDPKMKKMYDDAKSDLSISEQMLNDLQKDIKNIDDDIKIKLQTMQKFKNDLETVALRPKLTTIGKYIDDLIEIEKRSENRNQAKIEKLEKMKKQEAKVAKLEKSGKLSKADFGH